MEFMEQAHIVDCCGFDLLSVLGPGLKLPCIQQTGLKMPNPSSFFPALQWYCSCLSVSLLSYDSRSILIRLDRRKNLDGERESGIVLKRGMLRLFHVQTLLEKGWEEIGAKKQVDTLVVVVEEQGLRMPRVKTTKNHHHCHLWLLLVEQAIGATVRSLVWCCKTGCDNWTTSSL